MTKFTPALAVILLAAFVPFGKAICQPGQIGIGQDNQFVSSGRRFF